MANRRTFRTLSLPIPTFERLDLVAQARGVSKAKLIERLVMEPAPACELSRDRALTLLAQSAEEGSVPARIAYARLMAQTQEPLLVESDPLDELADRRRGRS